VIHVLKSCERELADFPEGIRGDLADALARLDQGLVLSRSGEEFMSFDFVTGRESTA
jgi:hypothetical protein